MARQRCTDRSLSFLPPFTSSRNFFSRVVLTWEVSLILPIRRFWKSRLSRFLRLPSSSPAKVGPQVHCALPGCHRPFPLESLRITERRTRRRTHHVTDSVLSRRITWPNWNPGGAIHNGTWQFLDVGKAPFQTFGLLRTSADSYSFIVWAVLKWTRVFV